MQFIVLFGFLCTTALAQVTKINVGPSEITVKTPSYPTPEKPNQLLKWELTTSNDKHISLICQDIRTNPSEGCKGGYLKISDGNNEEKYCGSAPNTKVTSAGNIITLELNLVGVQGIFTCTAVAIGIGGAPAPVQDEKIHITKLQPAYELEYNNIPPGTKRSWTFSTERDAKLSLYCTEINLYSGNGCSGASLYISSGSTKESVCTGLYQYAHIASTNEMKLDLQTTIKVSLKCIVQAITGSKVHQYQNVVSYEIDSREHGSKAGQKSTTCACGTSNKPQSRVIHGHKAAQNEFPFVATLQFDGSHQCGGSILTSRHVLSAAHCTHGFNPKVMEVLVGQNKNHEPLTTGQKRKVIQVVNHENYNPKDSYVNDITILVVENDFTFSKNVMPVCLPSPRHPINVNHKYVTLMGWGIAQVNGEKNRYIPTDLMATHMRVVDYPTCNAIFYWAFSPSSNPNKFCTWSSIRDSCNGDSGGPLVWLDPETNRYTQLGLVSFGRGCNTDYPKINTYVRHYYDWIQKVVRDTSSDKQTCEKRNHRHNLYSISTTNLKARAWGTLGAPENHIQCKLINSS